MHLKKIVINHIDKVGEDLIDYLDEIKEKGKGMGDSRGLLYFAHRAPAIMAKIDNLDIFKDVVEKMEFIKYSEIDIDKGHRSIYGTYGYKNKFFYDERLEQVDEETALNVMLNEIVYSMLVPTATGADSIIRTYIYMLPQMYYAMGLICAREEYGSVNASRKLSGAKIEKSLIYIKPNKESIKKRYKFDKEEDDVVNYFTIERIELHPRLTYTYEFRENGKKQKVTRKYPLISRFKKGLVDETI